MTKDDTNPKSAIKKEMSFILSDPPIMGTMEELRRIGPIYFLYKKLLMIYGKATERAPALTFMESPNYNDAYAGVVKAKRNEIPDSILKMVRVQDHLVAAILTYSWWTNQPIW